jgi:hypothetical protein
MRVVLGSANALADWPSLERPVTSILLQIECLRALDRVQSERSPADLKQCFMSFHDAMDRLDLIAFSDDVIARAGQSFGQPIKTLDAIHLASALVWRETEGVDLMFVTHDKTLAGAAESMDFTVVGYP